MSQRYAETVKLMALIKNHSYRLAFISSQAFSIINFRGPLVQTLVNSGVTVYALAPDYDNASRSAVRGLGAVPVDYLMARTGMNPLQDMFGIFRLVFQLRKLKLDAAFTYFIKPVIYGSIAARLAAVPKRFAMIEGAGYVFADEVRLAFYRRLLRSIVTLLYRMALNQVDRVFMLNPDDKELFVNQKMVAAKNVYLLDGIGLDLDHYQIVEVFPKQTCFILIARLIKEKGIYDYVEAARKIKMLHPEVRFVLVGNVDLNPSSIAKSVIHEWVSEGVIEWPGVVDDVRPWIAQASVFVLPSYYREGLPRSIQEAMAMGRPIITTDSPGCRQTVEHGVNGFLVSAHDSDALAEAMMNFVRQPGLVVAMGVESRRMAEKRFDVRKINDEILKAMGLCRGRDELDCQKC